MEVNANNNVVCVVATEKHTGFIRTSTSCNIEDSQKYAKYYRSIGYNARVVTYEELDKMQEKEQNERNYARSFDDCEWQNDRPYEENDDDDADDWCE